MVIAELGIVLLEDGCNHYDDVIMSAMVSQITSLTKTSKLHVTVLCEGNSSVTCEFPAQRASNAKMFPFDDVFMKMDIHEFAPLCKFPFSFCYAICHTVPLPTNSIVYYLTQHIDCHDHNFSLQPV